MNREQVKSTYDGGGDGSVQPPSPLTDQLGSLFRYIRLCFTRFDVSQRPPLSCFGSEFETQDPIFSEEHVLLEDTHPVDPVRSQSIGETVIASKVLFERFPLDI
jgi:hypothetical protein